MNYAERLEHVRELKRRRRVEALDRLVPERKCPGCGEVRPNSKQWVVIPGKVAVCLGCYRSKPDG